MSAQPPPTSPPTASHLPPPAWKYAAGVLRRLLQAMMGAYGLAVTLNLLLRFLMGDSMTIVALQTTFAHLSWLPALVLLPLVLLLRWWFVAALLLPAVLSFTLTYGGQFLPREVTIPDDAQSVTLLTYNLLANDRDYSTSVDIIRQADADIVSLQEVSLQGGAVIAAAFADVYPYQALHPNAQGTAGQGVLSRFPITADLYWRYDWLPYPLGHQRVELEIDGRRVVLYNAHPTHPGMAGAVFNHRNRDREVADLLARIADETDPVIMAGDFNLTDLSDAYEQIRLLMADAYRSVGYGMGFTFPSGASVGSYIRAGGLFDQLAIPLMLRLDYVFYDAHFQAIDAQVIARSGGSDHRPLWVELAFLTP